MVEKTLPTVIAEKVVERGDQNYESVRRDMVWNELKPRRYPEMIVQATTESDVIETINFARHHKMKIAVRGGGHNWNGSILRDDGILLDLSYFNQVSIDAAARTAVMQPVISAQELARKLSEYGLAFPVGHCSSVSMSGFILNGGFGWNSGTWGLACHSLTALDVVTAEGQLITASETKNSDLFWAARGAGPGFFGVVTKYYLKLYPLPKAITTSTLVYPLEYLPEVVEWITGVVKILRKCVELRLVLATGLPGFADQSRKVCIVSATAFADTNDEAVTALSPLACCPVKECVLKHLNVRTPFEALFTSLDSYFPDGKRYAADTLWSQTPPLTVLTKVQELFTTVPSANSNVLFIITPPPPADVPPLPDAAFSMLAPLYVACYSIWDEPDQDAINIEWLRQTMAALKPFATGHFVGESDLAANPSRAQRSFLPQNWKRLQALKKQYDPNDVFQSYLGLE